MNYRNLMKKEICQEILNAPEIEATRINHMNKNEKTTSENVVQVLNDCQELARALKGAAKRDGKPMIEKQAEKVWESIVLLRSYLVIDSLNYEEEKE